MNATSLLVSTTRLALQADARGVGDPSTLSDLYRLVPYLRQSLSCTVCAQLLREPYTPQAPQCQHHVCRNCLGGRKNLKPTCQWCRDYQKYEINTQLRILLQCYRHLCEYIVSKPMYRHVIGGAAVNSVAANASSSTGTVAAGPASASNQHNGNGSHSHSLLDLIEEGARFKDNYKSNSGQLKTTYSMLPCVYNHVAAPTVQLPPVAVAVSSSAAVSHGQAISRTTTVLAPMGMTTTNAGPQQHTSTAQRVVHAANTNTSSHVDIKPDIKVMNLQRAQLMHAQARPQQQQQQQQHQQSAVRHTHIRIQTPQQQQTQQQPPPQKHLQQQHPHPNMPQYKSIANTKWIAASTADSRHSSSHLVAHSSTPAKITTTIKPVAAQTTATTTLQRAGPAPASTSYTVATSAPIKTVSNGSAMYSVMYAGTGNKITIKRKTDTTSGAQPTHYNATATLNPAGTALRRIATAATTTTSPMQAQQLLNRPATVSPLYKDQKLPATLLTTTTATTTVSAQSGQPTTIRYQTLPSQQQQQQQQHHHFNPAMMQHAPLMHGVQLQQPQQSFKKPVPAGSRTTITATSLAASTVRLTTPATTTTILSTTPSTPAPNASAAAKRKGCRCGNATPTPGKLTCCGQRCPCYVEAKSCVDCKCRGCRNPHRADGFKIRPHIPELDCIEMLTDTDGSNVLRSVMAPVATSTSTMGQIIGGSSVSGGTVVSMAANRLITSVQPPPQQQRLGTSFLTTTPTSGTISLDASSLHGLSLDQDSIIFNPNDIDDVVNVYTTHQMPSSTLNFTTLPTTILMQDNSAAVAPSKNVAVSVPTSTTRSFFSTILASTGGKPQTKLLASVAGEAAPIDDDNDEEDDEDDDDDEEEEDDDDGEEEDDDVKDVSYVPENDIGSKHSVQMETGTSVSYHIDGPDGDEHQLTQFEHILNDAQLSSSIGATDELTNTAVGAIAVTQQQADGGNGAEVVEEDDDDDDDDEDDDDDDVEDDDEDDEDFSMSDEPSDLDIDI